MSKLLYYDTDYPCSDGKPMSDNTLQFRWITTLVWGLQELFKNDPNVFVAGDLLWYPVEGKRKLRTAPDVLVAFGRPKGDRGSYLQWLESDVSPQVVMEVLSPGNRAKEIARKFKFYEKYGVQEYYIYDPDRIKLQGYLRGPRGTLKQIRPMHDWISPLLGIRFDLSDEELKVIRPDGMPLMTPLEAVEAANAKWAESARADQESARAREESARADQAAAEVARLRQKLRDAGLDAD